MTIVSVRVMKTRCQDLCSSDIASVGTDDCKVSLRKDGSGNTGIYSTKKIKKDEVLFFIPFKFAIVDHESDKASNKLMPQVR